MLKLSFDFSVPSDRFRDIELPAYKNPRRSALKCQNNLSLYQPGELSRAITSAAILLIRQSRISFSLKSSSHRLPKYQVTSKTFLILL